MVSSGGEERAHFQSARSAASVRTEQRPKKMTLSKKLYGTVAALAFVGILVAGTGWWYLRMLGDELNLSTGKTALKLDLVNAARARSWEMLAALRGTFLFATLDNQKEFDACKRRWNAAFQRAGEQIRELRPAVESDRDNADLTRYESALSGFQKVSLDYIRACGERKSADLATLLPAVEAFAGLADETLGRMRDRQRKFLKDSQARSASLRAQSLAVTFLMSGVLLAIAILAFFTVRGINRTLLGAVTNLSEGAARVASSARQVASSSQSLAQGSSQQAASLQETSASSAEIESIARKNSENSGAAAGLVTQSQQKFVQTNQSLDQMVVAMGEISTQSDKISRIIKVIDEIAFQTNILALNAAVEAARAGEAGLGFAVVADEVRNLAHRCAQAAKDTAELIAESIARSNAGKAKVDQMATAIRGVTEDAGKVKALVEEVTLGSREQARGIEQISKAMTQMEQVTQKTAAGAQESASAAQELTAQSLALKNIVERLTALLGGKKLGGGKPPLRKSLSPPPKSPKQESPAPASRAAASGSFPLDDRFIEF
jgi:methyl-accepting chemotaxis protein/methyl-accepting chemotaxis protein-1 (serine sensor receptor)